MHTELDPSTRNTILLHLRVRNSLSVNELSQLLGITEMAVRRHLHTLERDGYVESRLIRQAMGRPASVYSLTASADALFPKNYQKLTLDLLEELDQEQAGMVDLLFERRRERLEQQYAPYMEGKALEERVAVLAELQNEGGYMVEWNGKDDGGFVFKEYNCPIAQVAGAYQQACSCELNMFRTLLGTEVERTECLAKGGRNCTYHIKGR